MPETRPLVVVRADGDQRLGMGHVARCLNLAEELARRGAAIRFVIRGFAGHFASRILEAGHEVRLLPPVDESERRPEEGVRWLGVDASRDAVETLEAIGENEVSWLVVDHYGIDAEWERRVRAKAKRIVVIDDLANRRHECDALLDQNWLGEDTANRYADLVAPETPRFLGPRFALLQPEYAELRRTIDRRATKIQRILVSFGGSDATNETGKVLDALDTSEFDGLAVDVVVGAAHPDLGGTRAAARRRAGIDVHVGLPSLAPLMVSADLAIGAGGSTSWERLCLNLPALVVTVAQNQEPGTAALDRAGFIRWLGSSKTSTPATYRDALSNGTIAWPDRAPLVDGLGVQRVCEVLLPSPTDGLQLRRAELSDALFFFDWRTDPIVRAMSSTDGPASWSAHVNWFRAKLSDPHSELYVAESRGLPVGQVRLDFRDEEAILSYSIDHLLRGRGWGRWIVAAVAHETERRPARGFRAHVKPENQASRRVFQSLGWAEDAHSDVNEIIFHRSSG